jgi:hypothetical protein
MVLIGFTHLHLMEHLPQHLLSVLTSLLSLAVQAVVKNTAAVAVLVDCFMAQASH